MSVIEEALKRAKRDGAPADVALRQRRDGAVPMPRAETPAPEKLALKLASRPLVEIDKKRLRDAGFAITDSAERRLMAEYRTIKRALLAAMTRRTANGVEHGNSVMIASALPGEGKTFTSINLALSLAAERDWTVVLVDADSAKQHITGAFGLGEERGLLDVLGDPRIGLTDVMFRTNLPGLNIVPAGRISETATELVASARMSQVLADLVREEPRAIVVFDSSPILLTTESRALADAVDQVLMVVRADSTARASVHEAIALLGEGHQVGLILNECHGTALQQSYYTDGVARVQPAGS
jgi:exopolysaccharide/PEP-CTERM locus tyrosine autokinase